MAIALNIPSQIEKYLSVALFPATGNEFTLYIANDTNRLYQWNGAAYIEVSQQDAVNWGSIGGDIINQTDLQLALAGKVDVEAGKGLSTNDYTTAEKNKLAGIEAGAQVNDVYSVNGYTGAVVLSKSDVGLSNVDNTSDLNKPISTATQTALNAKQDNLGFTPVPTSRTLTINGVTQDLSANRTFTISTGITIGSTAIASGVVGRVLFEGAGNVVQESANLFWDNTNGRLGIGTSSPSDVITLLQPIGFQSILRFQTLDNTTANGYSGFNCFDNSGGLAFSFAYGNPNSLLPNSAIIGPRNATGRLSFVTGSSAVSQITMFPSGNLLLQNGGTHTDAGFRLDVNGTARVKTDLKIETATGGLIIEGDAGGYPTLKINTLRSGTTRRNWMFATEQFNGGDFVLFRSATAGGVANTLVYSIFNDGNFGLNTSTNAGFRLDVNGTARVSGLVTANGYRVATNGEGLTAASATVGIVSYGANGAASGYTFSLNNGYSGGNINRNFFAVGDNFYLTSAFSSGTNTTNWFGVYPVINNTGGTTTSRGFYYNPTLTNTTGTTHFAFHSTSGLIRFENLPTSSAGLPTGTLYNNLGVLMIA